MVGYSRVEIKYPDSTYCSDCAQTSYSAFPGFLIYVYTRAEMELWCTIWVHEILSWLLRVTGPLKLISRLFNTHVKFWLAASSY